MKLLTIDDLAQPGVESRLQQAEQIYEKYCQYMENAQEASTARPPGIHASELVGCTRKAIYSIRGVDKLSPVPLPWKRRFSIGHAIHDMIQKQFGSMARNPNMMVGFEPEVPISPYMGGTAAKYNIFSSCDGVLTFYDRGEHGWEQALRVGIEIKSESPDGFAKLTKPKPEHIQQAHVYMKCLNLPLMWFIYYNKGNQNMTPSTQPFLIKFDPQIWNELEKRCEFLLDLAKKDGLPSGEEGVWCEFCPYAWDCEPKYLSKKSNPYAQIRRKL